jgi:hypothetical protein
MKKITFIFITILIILYLPASLLAAQRTITTYTWDKNILVTSPGSATGKDALPPFIPPSGSGNPQFPPIVNNTASPSITIDPVTQSIAMGSGIDDGSGSLWYGGTSPAGTCNPCNSGVCTFGLGFRAYFEFIYITKDSSTDSNANADGFTFTVMNAQKNDIWKRGGPPNTSVSLGELMGYAGPGNTSSSSSLPLDKLPLDGLGLEPPKFAIEFDTYPNPTAMTYNGCSNGRNDHNNNNHVALMFWGQNLAGNCDTRSTAGSGYPQASFDDNVHGAGDGTTSNPYNSSYSGNGSGLGGYYERAKSAYNWLEDGQTHRVRIEVFRTSATRTYEVKVWVDCESLAAPYTACPVNEYIYFQDIYNPYTNNSYLPKIDRTQQLDATLSPMLDNILFGFTEGTGAATQQLQINNFSVYFPTSNISPTSASYSVSAATGQTVSVAAAATSCAWPVKSNNDWITVTSPAGPSGTGAGTVTYSITANGGAARTGTITIGGQIFTVTQAGCTITVGTPSNLSFALGGGNGTVSITATAGCPWATSNNGNTWITVTPASSAGTGAAQTVNYSVAANAGVARTGTMTIANQTFTVTQAGKLAQTISALTFNPTTLAVGGTATASATATSGLAVTFSSTTPGVCTTSGTNGSTITGITAGTCTIAANQAGNATYAAAPQVTNNITVGMANQTISTITFTPATLVVGGTTTATATATSGLPVTFSSITTGVCTASGTNGSTITGVAAGTCMIAANQAGNANYNPATQVTGNITVGKANQSTLTVNATTPLAYNTSETLGSTGGSGTGAVTYSSTGSCIVAGTTLTANSGTGTCSVTATKAADTNYNVTTSGAVIVTLSKANQATLTVNATTPLAYNTSETLGSTGGSGTGAITYSATGSCTVSGTTLTANSGTGMCSVTATKAADTNYNATTSAAVVVTLSKSNQTISAITFTPSTLVIGGTTTASATATSGLTVTFSSTTPGVCTASGTNGSTITGIAAGTCTIAANQAGNANYNTALQVTNSVTISCTLTIADNSFACKSGTGNVRVYIKVYLTDGAGNPVTDATVTYTVSGGGGNGTLTNNGGGYYGGNQTSNCGLGGTCVRTGNLSGSRTVTITATRAGCTGSPLTKTMTVP